MFIFVTNYYKNVYNLDEKFVNTFSRQMSAQIKQLYYRRI